MKTESIIGSRQELLEQQIAAGKTVKAEDLAAAIAEDAAAARIAELETIRQRKAELELKLGEADAMCHTVRKAVAELDVAANDGRFKIMEKAIAASVEDYIKSVLRFNRDIASLRVRAEQAQRARASVLDGLARLDGDDRDVATDLVNRSQATGMVEFGGISVNEISGIEQNVSRVFNEALARSLRPSG